MSQSPLKDSLREASAVLDSTLLEFSKTTRELTELEQRLAILKETPVKEPPSSALAPSTPTSAPGPATPTPTAATQAAPSPALVSSYATLVQLDESAHALSLQLESLQEALTSARAEEGRRTQRHAVERGALQEAWDRLVNLRTHISLFEASIAEAAAEEQGLALGSTSDAPFAPSAPAAGSAFAPSAAPSTPSRPGQLTLTHTGAAAAPTSASKLLLRDALKGRQAVAESVLSDLRHRLGQLSSQLGQTSRLVGSSALGGGEGGVHLSRDVAATMQVCFHGVCFGLCVVVWCCCVLSAVALLLCFCLLFLSFSHYLLSLSTLHLFHSHPYPKTHTHTHTTTNTHIYINIHTYIYIKRTYPPKHTGAPFPPLRGQGAADSRIRVPIHNRTTTPRRGGNKPPQPEPYPSTGPFGCP